jgi:hypothetical protein
LEPDGLLVFTTHGRYYAESLAANADLRAFDMSAASRTEMLADFEDRGFGYQQYPGQAEYGLSLSSPSWVCATVARHAKELRLVSYTERAWRGTHDIVAYQRGYTRRLPSDAA